VSAAAIVVALLTPFREDGRIDREALVSHVDSLVTAGVDGLLVAGTTGEGPLLADDELVELAAAVVEAAAGRAPVTVNVGRPSTSATLTLIRRTAGLGAAGLAIVTPYYYALDDRELLAHYRAALDAAEDIPVLAYTIPSRANNDVSPALARTLAAEGLAGIKDSTKSLERHEDYLEIASETFAVYMGSDGFAYESIARGSSGCMSAIANLRPDLLLELRQAVLDGADPEPLRAELAALRAALARESSILGLKRALASNGYPPFARPPLQPVPAYA
jgi:4-hydroxy-tetrahydrodipicolinate synthase